MPELGKATYALILNSAQFSTGLKAAEAQAVTSTSRIAASMGRADAAAAGMAASTAGAGAAARTGMGRAEAATSKAASGFSRASSAASKAGHSISMGLSLPIAIAGGMSIKMSMEFSEAMQMISAQAGGTTADVEFLTKAVKDMAKTSIHGPKELADALFHLKSVGMDNAEAMVALRASSDLAMVGQADLEGVTNVLAGAFKTGMKGGRDFNTIIGTLNATIGAGNMRMDDLAGALSTGLLPVAKIAGMSLRDVGTAIATLTAMGIPAQAAATRLQTSLMMLIKPTPKAAKALADVGISGEMLGKIMRREGIVGVITKLRTAFAEIEDPVKRAQAMFEAFGGIRGAKTTVALIESGNQLANTYDRIGRDGQRVGTIIDEEMAEPANRLRIAFSKMKVSMIDLGTGILPIVATVAERIAGAFEHVSFIIGSLPRPVKQVGAALLLTVAVAGPLLIILGKLGKAILFLGMGGATGKAVRGLFVLRGAMVTTSAATMTMGLGWPLMAIAAVAAITTIILNLTGLDDKLRDVGGKIAEIVGKADDIAPTAGIGVGAFDYNSIQQRMQRKYQGLVKRGYSADDAAMITEKSFPGMTKDDIKILGPRGGQSRKELAQMKADAGKKQGKAAIAARTPEEKAYYAELARLEKEARQASKTGAEKDVLGMGFQRLELKLAEAQRTKAEADDRRVLAEEASYIKRTLQRKGLKLQQKVQLTQQLASIETQIRGIDETAAAKAKEEHKKQREAALELWTPAMRIRLSRAEMTEGLKDDIQTWEAEKQHLQQLLKQKNLTRKEEAKLYEALADADKKLKALRKKEADRKSNEKRARLQEIQAAMDLRGTFFGQFAPNIFSQGPAGLELGGSKGGGGTKVEQTNIYNEIPKDRHDEARRLKRATRGATQ